jgi:conjugal transfer/entry exclusion protein
MTTTGLGAKMVGRKEEWIERVREGEGTLLRKHKTSLSVQGNLKHLNVTNQQKTNQTKEVGGVIVLSILLVRK